MNRDWARVRRGLRLLTGFCAVFSMSAGLGCSGTAGDLSGGVDALGTEVARSPDLAPDLTAGAETPTLPPGTRLRAREELSLHAEPEALATVLALVPPGSEMTSVDGLVRNGFYQVTFDGKQGWSEQGLLERLVEPAAEPCGAAEGYYVFTCGPGGRERLKCQEGVLLREPCPSGCSTMPLGVDDRCVDPSEGPSVTPLFYQVPYISQMSSAGTEDDWNASSNCGPTTMAMIARAFDYRNDLREGALINHLGTYAGVGVAGAGADKIERMAARMGKPVQGQWNVSMEWIKARLREGKLVAANGNRVVTLKYDGVASNDTWGIQGHWIAVVGLTAEGSFLIHDPSVPKARELTPSQLREFIVANENGEYAAAVGP